jgi:hypothetical protein
MQQPGVQNTQFRPAYGQSPQLAQGQAFQQQATSQFSASAQPSVNNLSGMMGGMAISGQQVQVLISSC